MSCGRPSRPCGVFVLPQARMPGSDQSFSVALLNSEDSGIVITSHYGKDMQRVYAKPIKNGKGEYSLSAEEEEAIKKAKEKT